MTPKSTCLSRVFAQWRVLCGPLLPLGRPGCSELWILIDPVGSRLDLFTAAPSDITRAIVGAWCAQLPDKVGHRNGLSMVRVPCPRSTGAAWRSFRPVHQKVLARSICDGYMSPAAKASWDSLESPTCELCHQVADKWHQLFACPATAALRAQYQATLGWVVAHSPHWAHGAFATENDKEPFLRLICGTRCLPLFFPRINLFGCSLMGLASPHRCRKPAMQGGP